MHLFFSLSIILVGAWQLMRFTAATSAINDISILINEVTKANNQSLLWGPYKSNLYFGVHPRIPKSFVGGLLWAKVDDYATAQSNFRHTCEQNEGMAGYGWDEYDIRRGGKQSIHDAGNAVDITIDFVKVPGGQHGGSWAARVKGVPREDAPEELYTSVIFYAGLEGFGALQPESKDEDHQGFKRDVKLVGFTPELGNFMLDVTAGPESNEHPIHDHPSYADKPLDLTFVSSIHVPPDNLWQVKNLLFMDMKTEVDAMLEKYGQDTPPPPVQFFTLANKPTAGNMHFIQKTFQGAFEFDILFSSGSASQVLTSEIVAKEIEENKLHFSDRFEKVFAPKAPFDSPEYVDFSKAMLSNLVGGFGYFYGSGIVDRSNAPEYEEENEGFWKEAAEARSRIAPEEEPPRELFTAVPSRPFFPRGFLWDEGFHLIPVIDYDPDVALDIVKSWFSLMDEDGWIAREQILGLEARSKVPMEFTVQYPHYANPPTLFIILEAFIDKLASNGSNSLGTELDREGIADTLGETHLRNPELAYAYLRSIYPQLKKYYFWFKDTQRGEVRSYDREAYSSKEAYRWRGRTPQHILTSGLDDYPRAQPPHPGELHTDLISWMGLASRSLRRIAEALSENEDAEEFTQYEKAITRNIDDLHWDEGAQTWCDATIDDYEESTHVCHKGYVSIFPFLTGMIGPDSPHLKPTLDLIRDPEQLWSDYGIRSLSRSDSHYGTAENYWRSPVWININYLVLKNLYDIAIAPGRHSKQACKMYNELRKNLVQNIFKEWKRTGFAWEQYSPETGQGQRTQHFTGWTSLVVKMMVMPELPAGKGSGLHDEL